MRRPTPLLNLGTPYLSPGTIGQGYTLPTGAVWNPWFMLYGTLQTAAQGVYQDSTSTSEWATRLDLYGNLQLSGTERLLLGFRPLDRNGGFTGYGFQGEPEGWQDAWSGEPIALFFEGDFSQLFPGRRPLRGPVADWGFTVGRQPATFQQGLLLDDDLDMFGLIRNTRLPRQGANLRHSLVMAWNEIHRDNNREDEESYLFGSFNAYDGPSRTLEADLIYVDDQAGVSSAVYGGLAAIQRVNRVNLSLRALVSQTLNEETAAASDGLLFFGEFSTTPNGTENLAYVNVFWGLDRFTSAARGPDRGGALGRTGILYEAVGIGRYGAPLVNRPEDAVGFALGYQMFFDHQRRQLVLELGGRTNTDSAMVDSGAGFGGRFQQAFGQHSILRMDAFVADHEQTGSRYGGRVHLQREF
ncbi:MAG: hypothetical protein ACI9TH_004439 [Kiritimatiellia bacterium]|jgi:hypothetical protein